MKKRCEGFITHEREQASLPDQELIKTLSYSHLERLQQTSQVICWRLILGYAGVDFI